MDDLRGASAPRVGCASSHGPNAPGCGKQEVARDHRPSTHPNVRFGDGLVRPSSISGFGTHETRMAAYFPAAVAVAVTTRAFYQEAGVR